MRPPCLRSLLLFIACAGIFCGCSCQVLSADAEQLLLTECVSRRPSDHCEEHCLLQFACSRWNREPPTANDHILPHAQAGNAATAAHDADAMQPIAICTDGS